MNFGALLLAFILVIGSVLGIIMIGSASQGTYVDSFGAVQGNTTNQTHDLIDNSTGAIVGGGGGGLVLLVAAFLVFVAAVFVFKSMSPSTYGGRR